MTAVTRSSASVAIAVRASTTASERFARIRTRTEPTSTIRTAVASRTPASTASGMRPTIGAAASMIAASVTACTKAASRELAPDRTLTAVLAMAAVAGTPPNIGVMTFAMPWPKSSRSGSWRWFTLMPSATVADSRLSRAASAATATADGSSDHSASRSRKDSDGAGSNAGNVPIRGTGRDRVSATTVPAATASSENGIAGLQRAPTSMMRTTPPARATAGRAGPEPNARTAFTTTLCPAGVGTPSAAGICCNAMTAAIPRVKPSTTGAGTYRM
ncbi:hypothetical protein LX88_004297 [Lentzea californiensis]|nr:hypothetical protein [Lentzea californiensis]